MTYALAITGPTASGKTALSIDIARALSLEIISCDSMQIYQGMDIGTAKATEEDRRAVAHHLIDFVSPLESYSAESYRKDALSVLSDIFSRGKRALFVGGTGLYVDTLMRKEAVGSPPSDPELRERLTRDYTPDELYERLLAIDPASAEKTHKNNVKRVVRALEIYELSGKTKSYFDELSRGAAPDVEIGMITLDFHNRDKLYERIDKRVDIMLECGLLSEVRALYEAGLLKEGTTAACAIGYKEMVEHIEGKITLAEATEKIKLASRRYAKRQLTWFRHERDAARLFVDNEEGDMRPYSDVLSDALSMANSFLNKFENKVITK